MVVSTIILTYLPSWLLMMQMLQLRTAVEVQMHEVETVLRRLHPDPTGTQVARWLEWVGMGGPGFNALKMGLCPC